MPNYCYFDMKVCGGPENIEKLVRAATDYDEPKHLWRVFEFAETGREENPDGTVSACFWGYCAWSVRSCMFEGDGTYADRHPEESTSIPKLSDELDLDIEIYSRETGLQFSEHYLYRRGAEEANEDIEFAEWIYDEDDWKSFGEFARETGLPEGVAESDFEDGIYVQGGYDIVWNV